jgi:hypothetical protein
MLHPHIHQVKFRLLLQVPVQDVDHNLVLHKHLRRSRVFRNGHRALATSLEVLLPPAEGSVERNITGNQLCSK